jgi:hypothetical protein
MITFIIDQNQVETNPNFSLQKLQEFSKKNQTKIIIRKFATLQNGIVVRLV